MHGKKVHQYTIEKYLELERDGDVRREYVNGEIVPTTGASEAHNIIAGNLYVALHNHLRGTPCRVFMNDMKVRIEETNHVFYPDLMVACDDTDDPHNRYYRDDPRMIVEVLSKSTAARDGEYKRAIYQYLPTLQEYAVVAQDAMRVMIYRRSHTSWVGENYGPGDQIYFVSVDLRLPIESIYDELETVR